MKTFPPKDPDSVVPYEFSWVSWLANEDDTLDGYEVAIDEGDDELVIDSHQESGGVITVWLSGGTLDAKYVIRTRVTTTGGRTEDLSARLRILQK